MTPITNKPSSIDFQMSTPAMKRRHSFSSYENATYKKPIFVDTRPPLSTPVLTDELLQSLVSRAIGLISHPSDMMVTHQFTKEALESVSLPFLQTTPPLVSEKIPMHPQFEWKVVPCKIKESRHGAVVVTEDHAVKIYSQGKESKYRLELQNEEDIIKKTNPWNERLGLPWEKISKLGVRTLYLYQQGAVFPNIGVISGLAYQTDAHLEDCSSLKFSSKEEVIKASTLLIHQVDVFHRLGICHMDIKPKNFCKTKKGQFKVIDRGGALDFTREETMERVKRGAITTTSYMLPTQLFQSLEKAKTPKEAQKIAEIADIFAVGSTIYQMAYAFTHEDYKTREALPYLLSKTEHPAQIKHKEVFNETLRVLNPEQQRIIKATLSTHKQSTLKALKKEFPL